MRNVYIHLDNGRLVKDFVEKITELQSDFELIADRTVLNAKSILGIYCLDLSQPLLLRIEDDSNESIAALKDFIGNYDLTL